VPLCQKHLHAFPLWECQLLLLLVVASLRIPWEQAIQDFITRYNQTTKPLKWSYTAEKLEHKLATHLLPGVKPEVGT